MKNSGLIIRTAVLIYALFNNALVLSGVNALPFADEQVEMVFAEALTVGATLWAWWKNNSVTKDAQSADKYMRKLKQGGN